MEMNAPSKGWLAVVVLLAVAELAWRLSTARGYDRRNALATVGLVVGGLPFAVLNAVVLGGAFALAWRFALTRLPLDDWRTWVAGFLAVEFAYYWFHRANHRIRWLWASHATHHSAEQLTLLSSFRLGWTRLFSAGWMLYLPLVLSGFDPKLIVFLLTLNLHYQFFLHTEAVGRLGPIEWLFNTPAHHRLHHASNVAYLDRNYGGVLIIFDRLFGTLATERSDEAIRYGLAHRPATANPLTLAFREWRYMFGDAMRARGLRGRLRALFGPPDAEVAT